MLVSLNWLREFVPYEGEVQPLADKLTMLGLEVDEVYKPFDLSGVVVGHVATCDKHPNADTLSVCTVEYGEAEPAHVVCGAPNVAAGQKICFATVGTELPNGLKLKKAKIRGEVSMGMICAEDEMGLGDDHAGIKVLDPEAVVGTPIAEYLGLDDWIIDIDLTPNRADCTSILGVAREVALAYDLPLTLPSFERKESGQNADELVKIEIDDPELCAVYQGRVIKDVKVAPSPDWLRYRLMAVGQRPINNMVDVTNYVMFAVGQPQHAFDMDTLKGGTVRVAPATDGMKFTTLDGQERTLLSTDLLIWDGERPVGLAGVMGGQETEVSDATTNVFLEAAVFRPATIRKTARRLALPSDASYRFERGVDQPGSRFANDWAAQLIADLGGGTLLPGTCLAEPRPWQQHSVRFRPERARRMLGIEVDDDYCRKNIAGMGCEITETAPGDWQVAVPSHRHDLTREEDFVEEVARIYGMDRIPTVLPHVKKPLEGVGGAESEYDFWMRIKRWARGVGLCEAINYSFVGQDDLDRFGLPVEGRIPVKNPLSEDQNVLRTALVPGLMNNVRHNLAQGNTRLRLFEMAHLFEADAASDTTARESGRLGILLHGDRAQDAWPMSVPAQPAEADYQDLKGLVDNLFSCLGLGKGGYALAASAYLTPCVEVTLAGRPIGTLGRVEPELADAYHAKKPVWIAEIDVDALAAMHAAHTIAFAALPTFPPSRRDITVMAPKTLPYGEVLAQIEGLNIPLLESVVLVDVYEPDAGEERNLTIRLTFRSPSKTLKDKEVDKQREKVANSLVKALPVRI